MESNRKIKVSVIIKYVGDKQDKATADKDADGMLTFSEVRRVLNAVSLKNDEEDKELILHLLRATKTSSEVMANAFIDAGRDDLFDEKVKTIEAVNEIITQINNYNQ
jgi:hypothetical protein